MNSFLGRCYTTRTFSTRTLNGILHSIRNSQLKGRTFSQTPGNFTRQQLDHYETLEVAAEASKQQIKTQYYKLSKKYHPDMNPGNERALGKFLRINEAYSVLSDDYSRLEYDRSLKHHRNSFRPRVRRNATDSSSSHVRKNNFSRPGNTEFGRFDFHGQKKVEFNFQEHFQRHYGQELRHAEKQRRRHKEMMEKYLKDVESRKFDNILLVCVTLFLCIASGISILYSEGIEEAQNRRLIE
ncbi:hypothetical protein G9A89_003104 [Geosiphon pyriformis]|nr:hypothetical protein G9A89_003104 [Geosiphon pyriformis]